MRTREAVVHDAASIHALVNSLSHDGTLLPRSFEEICENVRDFVIAEDDFGGFLGCGALHIYSPRLAEIRSIVVQPQVQRCGVGHALLLALLDAAATQRIPAVCCFTRVPRFFSGHGFAEAARELIPEKIRKDCLLCPRLHACDEVAMVRGVLLETPEYEAAPTLVQLTA